MNGAKHIGGMMVFRIGRGRYACWGEVYGQWFRFEATSWKKLKQIAIDNAYALKDKK